MAVVARTVVTLRFFGDDLDPDDVSARLGGAPSRSRRKGDLRTPRDGRRFVERSGSWRLSAKDRTPGDLSAQIDGLLSGLTSDLAVWQDLTQRYSGDVFCGLFMDRSNEGLTLSPATLAALGDRGLDLDLDIYEPTRDEIGLQRHAASIGSDHLVAYVGFDRSHAGVLSLRFVLRGDFSTVRFAEEVESERADDLWRTTCFEVFVRVGEAAYFEFNVSPSTRWAAYRFDAYRGGMAPANVDEPSISVDHQSDRFELWAELDLASLAELADLPWHIGLSAVVEDSAGRISYWALAHPGEKPDFHHPDSFVLELPPP